jgi:hypothetical protein
MNYEEFYCLLLAASRGAFTTMQEQHPDETFYAFSLSHEPLWAYIHPTANSDQGLTRCAQEYQQDKFKLGYARLSLDELRDNLRWSSGDFAYSQSDHFQPVNEWLTAHNVYWLYDDSESKRAQMHTHLIEICCRVLQNLDAEGVFIRNQPRNQVVLNLLMGDQDLTHARQLNPPDVYQRWLEEIKIGRG